jgi:IPT/TIG domain-containing protein
MTRDSSRKVNVVLATMALAVSAACSGPDAHQRIVGLSPPAPTVTSISPNSAVAGGAAFTLTVSGASFDAASTVNFGGTACATSFVNATKLTAVIPALVERDPTGCGDPARVAPRALSEIG